MGMVDAMNANDMLDYALGQLDPAAREQADREIAADPGQAERLDRLSRALGQLLDESLTGDRSRTHPTQPTSVAHRDGKDGIRCSPGAEDAEGQAPRCGG